MEVKAINLEIEPAAAGQLEVSKVYVPSMKGGSYIGRLGQGYLSQTEIANFEF